MSSKQTGSRLSSSFVEDRQLNAQHFLVPRRAGDGQLVVGDYESAPLGWREMAQDDDGDFFHAELPGREQTCVPRDNVIVGTNEDRVRPPPFRALRPRSGRPAPGCACAGCWPAESGVRWATARSGCRYSPQPRPKLFSFASLITGGRQATVRRCSIWSYLLLTSDQECEEKRAVFPKEAGLTPEVDRQVGHSG
jgi:hypothetical protein